MHIVRASLVHLPDAALLLNEYYESVGVIIRDAPELLASYLSDHACGLWIAYVDEVAAGCVVMRPLPSIDHAAECKRLYVRSEFRGRGIADALLHAMEEHAVLDGLQWVYLDSMDDLRDALRIYSRRGYEACERYNDNPQATVFMRKKLVAPCVSAIAPPFILNRQS